MILEIERGETLFIKRKGFKKLYRIVIGDYGDIEVYK